MAERTCTIDGCDRAAIARGWCSMHYKRWHKHGDPLHLPPRQLPPQNRPKFFGCKADDCDRKHHAVGYCHRHYSQWWYRENEVRAKAWQAEYRANPEHRVKAMQTAHQWRQDNPERTTELRRAYAQANADVLREKRRQYRDANRDKIRALNNRRKALQRDVEVNDLTAEQWVDVIAAWGGRCAYCGVIPDRITMDHVIPLSRGGHHTASNVVPACGPCNSAKSDGPAPPFIVM